MFILVITTNGVRDFARVSIKLINDRDKLRQDMLHNHTKPLALAKTFFWHNYRKRGSASYIVREVLSVRERERLIPKTIGNRKRDCA